MSITTLFASLSAAKAQDRLWKVMAVGDSITEGSSTGAFANWRYPLWEKLTAAGYFIEYVGSRSAASRIGTLKHEGYSGQNVEYLATRLQTTFPANSADIVLLHAGHNYDATVTPNPVPQMLTATESIIATCRAKNPQVTILLAQVIPSLKLPKYSYIPDFNAALPALAARLNTPTSRIILVDHATGFDPAVDTVSDQVHPSESGAAKMRDRWFDALAGVLPAPEGDTTQPTIRPYKTPAGSGPLNLHVFTPSSGPATMRPAIVFFFAGGWNSGTPIQFYNEARHFAAQGYVAVSADYRIIATHPGNTTFECVADAKSAIRHLRENAAELGIDPHRIIGAGASAGGHIAAAAALLPGLDDPTDNLSVSARPDALVLWYPVIDNGPGGFDYDTFGSRYTEISPLHNIGIHPPPTLTLLGTADPLVPVATGQEFTQRLQSFGGRAELILYQGGGHPVYAYRDPSTTTKTLRADFLANADAFLKSLALVSPRPLYGRVGKPLPPLVLRELNAIIPSTWTLANGRLPAGVSLTTDGLLTGTPTETGEFPLTLHAIHSAGPTSYPVTLRIANAGGPVALAANPAIVFRNIAYRQALAVRGAAGPVQWLLDPATSLPAGIIMSPDGILSGTATAAAGDYPITVRITDSSGESTSTSFTLTVRAAAQNILDVGNPGVTTIGTWTSSTAVPGYYGSAYHHDGNTGKGSKSVTYNFTGLAPGDWSLSAMWTPGTNRDVAVPYRVETSAATVTHLVDQTISNGSWNPLGTVTVPANGVVKVIILNQGTTNYVMADAVRLSTSSIPDTPAARYARWAAALPEADRGPSADPLGNGWPNLLSFYAGRTAGSSDATPPLLQIQPDGSLRAFFNRSLPEFPAMIEASPDLIGWQTITTSADVLATSPAFDGEYPVPVPNATLRFFRHKVSLPDNSL